MPLRLAANWRCRPVFVGIALVLFSTGAGRADSFVQEDLRIPLTPASGAGALETLLVRPNQAGRFPLALLGHGSPRSAGDRETMTPLAMLPQALELARRGWAAAIVMRRGYGTSNGGWAESYGSCANPNYVAAGNAGAADLMAAVNFLGHRPNLDVSRMIGLGVSAGGFAMVALAADPPTGLKAVLNFAGGRGSVQDGEVCAPDRLIDAYRVFGSHARIPMLWVYAQNDHFFAPSLARKFQAAFSAGGDSVDFISAPAFGSDGHGLFSPAGIPVWTRYMDAFLARQNLLMRAAAPVEETTPSLTPPRSLGSNGRKAFESYLVAAPHKAFAISRGGGFGWRSGQRTPDEAKAGALKFCEQNGAQCTVTFIDDAAAPAH